jgi:hypothetical protein
MIEIAGMEPLFAFEVALHEGSTEGR